MNYKLIFESFRSFRRSFQAKVQTHWSKNTRISQWTVKCDNKKYLYLGMWHFAEQSVLRTKSSCANEKFLKFEADINTWRSIEENVTEKSSNTEALSKNTSTLSSDIKLTRKYIFFCWDLCQWVKHHETSIFTGKVFAFEVSKVHEIRKNKKAETLKSVYLQTQMKSIDDVFIPNNNPSSTDIWKIFAEKK